MFSSLTMSFGDVFRRLLQLMVGVSFLLVASQSMAGSADIEGNVSADVSGNRVTIAIDRIKNNTSNTTTGTLYVTIRLTTGSNPHGRGYNVARHRITGSSNGRLGPGQSFSNIRWTLDFSPPPPGTYYVHLYTSEYPNLDTTLDVVTFDGRLTIGGGGGGGSADIEGNVSADVSGNRVTIAIDRIKNNTSNTTTGTLYVTMWLTAGSNPIGRGFIGARHRITGSSNGRLGPGQSFSNIRWPLDFSPPPPGTYYVHLYTSEYPNLDTTLDVVTFDERLTIGGGGGSADIEGNVSADVSGNRVTIAIDRIKNNTSNTTTGTLYVTMWLTAGSNPIGRGFIGARHRITGSSSGRLGPGQSFSNIRWPLDFSPPPPGTYYVHLYTSEYPNLDTTLDVVTLRGTLTIGSGGGGSGLAGTGSNIGDFNGDGRDDVLVRHTSGSWHYYAMNGRRPLAGTSGAAALTRDTNWRLAGIGDFNGDGRDDVLVRRTSGSWYYYAMNGRRPISGTSGSAALTRDTNWRLAGIGDFNGDGRDDVLVRHTSGSWYYYAMNGRRPISGTSGSALLTSDTNWRLAGIGDFNGDGRDDVLVRHTSGSWYYYAMNGRRPISGTSGGAALTRDNNWRLVGIGDFNGDRRDDVLVRHTSGSWYYYAMNGRRPISGTSGAAALTRDTNWRLAGIGDFNGDGRDDVLVRHTSGSWHYYAMNGRRPLAGTSGAASLTSDTSWAIPHPSDRTAARAASGRDEPQVRAVEFTYVLPLLTASSNEFQRGIVRVINHSDRSGTVAIHGIDSAGIWYGPVTLTLEAKASVYLDSAELEDGSPSKGLPGGLGHGTGNWRLNLTTELDIQPLAYVRNVHGAFTPMHGVARTTADDSGNAVHHVSLFQPAGDGVHQSRLRLINLSDVDVAVTIRGVDDAGHPAADTVRLTLPAGQVRTLTAQHLETPDSALESVSGGLGDGDGNWRLSVVADGDIAVMNLLLGSDTVANFSASRSMGPFHDIPFVPASNGSWGGYVRIINHSDESGDVVITGIDEAGNRRGPITLSIGPGESVHLSSRELATGNSAKGLSAGLGDEETNWRLTLESELELEPFAYIRSADGFARSMHEVVRTTRNDHGEIEHHVPFFTPAHTQSNQSLLRVMNMGEASADVTIAGRDDAGTATTLENRVHLTLPAGATRVLTAQELESGDDDFTGHLGDGNWQLTVTTSSDSIQVMSLSRNAGGLTNLSSSAKIRIAAIVTTLKK